MRQKSVTRHRESLERKGWPGAVPQQVFDALEIAWHITVDERDPDIGQEQIEDLKRRAEQGSQQLQGEVEELEYEGVPKESFPTDVFTPVAKGVFAGDVVHTVARGEGLPCGKILWESNHTRHEINGWLVKLRDD